MAPAVPGGGRHRRHSPPGRWSLRREPGLVAPWASLLAVRLTAPRPTEQLRLVWYSQRSMVALVDVAELYAVHADLALRAVDLRCNLEVAVRSRHRIGLAQGILMARFGRTEDQAFELLRQTSQVTNTKLRQVAEQVNLTGRLPD